MPPIVYVPVAPLAQLLSPVLRYPFPSSHRSGLPFGETYQVIRFWVTVRSALLRVSANAADSGFFHRMGHTGFEPVVPRTITLRSGCTSGILARTTSLVNPVGRGCDGGFCFPFACRGGCCGGVWEDLLRAREDGYDDRCYVEGRVKSGPLTVRSIRSKATLSKGATQCQRPSGWIPASDQ